jgi:hypothetical protein
MRRKLVFAAVVLGLLMGTSSVASAQAFTETFTVHDFTEVFVDVNPCTGDPGTVTLNYNGVFHGTVDPNGGFHFTGTLAGTFELVPLDSSLPTYTGHFAQWFGGNTTSNSDGFWATFNIKGNGSDGSTLSVNAVTQIHFSNGVLHIQFERLNCHS